MISILFILILNSKCFDWTNYMQKSLLYLCYLLEYPQKSWSIKLWMYSIVIHNFSFDSSILGS